MLSMWLACSTDATSSLVSCPQQSEPTVCIERSIQSFEGTIDEAILLCQQLPKGALRGECAFLLSDGSELIGDVSRTMCAVATPFEEDCLRHAAAREVEKSILPTLSNATPNPMKLLPRIHGVVRQYLPAEIAESMSRDMMIRFQASRVEQTFDSVSCIGLNPSICAQVYIVASLGSRGQWTEHFDEPWMDSCSRLITVEDAKAWNWKQWTLAMDTVVQQAHQQLCQALPAAKSDSLK